jgi:hypothetical protein
MKLPILLATAGLAFVASVAQAQNLTVNIEPANKVPHTVAIEVDGVPTDLARQPPAGAGYQGTITLPDSVWANNYLVVARWPGVDQGITLRISRDTPPVIKMWIYNREHPYEKNTLDSIDKGKAGLNALLERYFVARDVYWGIDNPEHEVKIRALKIWYDAAFSLSKTYRYIARDEEVVRLADEIEVRRRTSPQLADTVRRLAGSPDYFGLMNKHFRALYLDEIAMVEQLVRQGKIGNAALINSYFLTKLGELPADERNALLSAQGITLETLEKNAKFLSTLQDTSRRGGPGSS